MNIKQEDGSLMTDYGQILAGPPMDVKDLLKRLQTMEGSKTAKDAVQWIERVLRLTNPIYMTLIEQAMCDQAFPDESRLFNFMGSGGSDFTFTAEWRALFGDEREELKEMDLAYKTELEAAQRGECTNVSGCQDPSHKGSCGFSTPRSKKRLASHPEGLSSKSSVHSEEPDEDSEQPDG